MLYKNLTIWALARDLSIEIHDMTMSLPQFEMFEEGKQIRKSSKNVRSVIVEGYGRRYYKQDFIKFLIYALASNSETLDHLEILFETNSLKDEVLYNNLHKKIESLQIKLNNFLNSVIKNHEAKYGI